MDENLHNIDDLFKRALDEHSETPSPRVWENLDKNLEKKKVVSITKKYEKWKWVAAALFIFSVGMAMYTWNLKLRYKEIARKNKQKTTNTINRSDIKRNDRGTQGSRDNSIDVAAGNSNQKAATAANSTSNKRNDITKTAEEKSNKDGASNASVKMPGKRTSRNTNQLSVTQNREKNGVKKSFSASNHAPEDKSIEDISLNSKGVKDALKNVEKAGDRLNISPDEDRHPVETTIESRQKNLQFNAPSIAIKDRPVISTAQNNLPAASTNKSNIKATKRGIYTATLFFSGQSVSTNLRDDRPRFREDDRREIKQKEKHGYARSIGVLISRGIGKGVSLQTGVGIVTRVTDIQSKTLFARPDNRGNVHYRISCSSGYAYVSTKSGTTPTSGDSIPALSSATTLKYISVPIGLQYTVRNGNFSFNPAVAVAANFRTRGKIQTVLSTPAGKENATTNIEGLKPSYFDGALRMDLAYDLTNNIGISLMPAARFGLSSITNGGPVKTYVNSLGLGLGLNVHF